MIVQFRDQGDRVSFEMDLPEAPSPGSVVRIKYKRTSFAYQVMSSEMVQHHEDGEVQWQVLAELSGPVEIEAQTKKVPGSDSELMLAYETCGSFAATARMYGCNESVIRRRIKEIRERRVCSSE